MRKEGGEFERGLSRSAHRRLCLLTPNVEERPVFNSPTCCRVEHGKVRLIARDRFNVLGFTSSERMTFDRFRELLDAQNRGTAERLLAIKYPHTARIIASSVAHEARRLCEDGPVHVMFIDGIGGWNPTTAGHIDAELHADAFLQALGSGMSPRATHYYELPPFAGGMLPVLRTLWPRTRRLFFETTELAGRVGFRR